jgi:hypothetical protein
MLRTLRAHFATRWFAGLAVVFLVCLLFLAADVRNRRFAMVDFEVFHKAAGRAWAGQNLYRPAEDGFYEYKYGPPAAYLFTPFALLPPTGAKVAYWLLLSLVIPANLLLCLRLARPGFRAEPPGRVNRLTLLAAASVAVHFMLELHLGQVNQLLLLLYLLAASAFAAGRPWLFGLPLAASLFLKPFALVFAPWLVLRRRWRELLATAAWTAAGAALPRLSYGAAAFEAQYRGWADRIGEEMAKKTALLAPANHTLASLLARYTPLRAVAEAPGASAALRLGVVALLALALLWYVLRGRELERPLAGDFAALLTVVPLLAFTNYNAFGSTMLAATVLLWNLGALGWARWPAIAGMVLVGGNLYDLWGRRLFRLLDDLSMVALGAALLLLALFAGRRRGAF